MTPSEAPKVGSIATGVGNAPAVFLRLETMKKRADFVRTSRALYLSKPGFVLQLRQRGPSEPTPLNITRVGFTCSKKVGNAVARNRAKRRLREIARLFLPKNGRAGCDYVLIGRRESTAILPFDRLGRDFLSALDTLHERLK
jgi:ribonuclease P protein component